MSAMIAAETTWPDAIVVLGFFILLGWVLYLILERMRRGTDE